MAGGDDGRRRRGAFGRGTGLGKGNTWFPSTSVADL
jgi:hypothetical protein